MDAESRGPAEGTIVIRRTVSRHLADALVVWAESTTRPDATRYAEYVQSKVSILNAFFDFAGKPANAVTPGDVAAWRRSLEAEGLAPSTIYGYVCRVSSFYELARKDEKLQQVITSNPTRIARPEAPAPYQNKRAQALADEEIQALLTIIRQHAIDNLHAKRDYALFLLYILTGMRRAEVIGLRWGDVKVGDVMKIRAQVKGGDFVEREVANAQAQTALLHYLSASGRLEHMRPETPLWTRHDRAGRPGPPLTARAFVENLKRYALEAGIPHIHLHQTRHTFARMVAEETGSLIETQDALGHAHLKTTRVYVKRIAVKKDKHSDRIASRLGI